MKTPSQHQTAPAVPGAAFWPPERVLAMDIFLLTHPMLDVQRWFEEQLTVHLESSPHGILTEVSRGADVNLWFVEAHEQSEH